MSSTSSSCVQPAGRRLVRAEARVVAVGRVPDRDAVPPPQLAADAPVAQVVDPLEVAAAQRRRLDDAPGRRAPRRRPPGRASRPARTTAATAAARSPCRSASSARPSAGTAASRRRCGRPRAARRRSRTAPPCGRDPANGPGAVMTPRSSMIVGIGRSWRRPISKSFGSCAGVTFTAPVPKDGSTCSSATIGMRPVRQRQRDLGADEVPVALVVGMDGHRGVAEHRLGPGGGHDDRRVAVAVADRDQLARLVRVVDLDVRQRGEVARAPVDDPLGAVDQIVVVEPLEDRLHGAGQAVVHA